jgi:hypothetical protein
VGDKHFAKISRQFSRLGDFFFVANGLLRQRRQVSRVSTKKKVAGLSLCVFAYA